MINTLDPYADMSVLIIDDNLDNVALLEAVAKDGGLRNVHSETDSRLVRQRLVEFPPDLVLLDLHMPHLDGYAVLAQIKEHAATTYLPVLVLTADGTTVARDKALSQGAQDFLAKPLDIVEVSLRMANLLQTRRLYLDAHRGRQWLAASARLAKQVLAADHRPSAALATDCLVESGVADFAIIAVGQEGGQVSLTAISGTSDPQLVTQLVESLTPFWAATDREEPELIAVQDLVESDIVTGPVMVVPLAVDDGKGALVLGRTSGRAGLTAIEVAMAAAFAREVGAAFELANSRKAAAELARVEDRLRIAADLHDHVIQDLFAVGMGLEGLTPVIEDSDSRHRLRVYTEGLDRAIGTIRTTIFQLQPSGSNPSSLKTNILAMAAEHTPQLGYAPRVRFSGPIEHAVDDGLAGDVLAVLREAISNCARHAQASRLDISLSAQPQLLTLDIVDDGRGIGTPSRSSGLGNMRRRAQWNGGSLTITTSDMGGSWFS